jgi:hypothetical protein
VNIDWDRKGEQVRSNTHEACRIADQWHPPKPPEEDDEGYVVDRGSMVKGPSWQGPQDGEWRDGEPWSWLFGAAS